MQKTIETDKRRTCIWEIVVGTPLLLRSSLDLLFCLEKKEGGSPPSIKSVKEDTILEVTCELENL